MQVDIASVVFEHHHLFSLEHYLANRLTEKYSKYQQTISRMAGRRRRQIQHALFFGAFFE